MDHIDRLRDFNQVAALSQAFDEFPQILLCHVASPLTLKPTGRARLVCLCWPLPPPSSSSAGSRCACSPGVSLDRPCPPGSCRAAYRAGMIRQGGTSSASPVERCVLPPL